MKFKTARKFLLENLEGGIAWKDPVQAEKQKERLKAEKGKGGILKGIGGGGAGRTNRRGRGVSGAGHESVIIGQGGKEKWKEEKSTLPMVPI